MSLLPLPALCQVAEQTTSHEVASQPLRLKLLQKHKLIEPLHLIMDKSSRHQVAMDLDLDNVKI